MQLGLLPTSSFSATVQMKSSKSPWFAHRVSSCIIVIDLSLCPSHYSQKSMRLTFPSQVKLLTLGDGFSSRKNENLGKFYPSQTSFRAETISVLVLRASGPHPLKGLVKGLDTYKPLHGMISYPYSI